MAFYGREKELKKLSSIIGRDEMTAGIIWGRRRVGKSELIKQVLKASSAKHIYYECRQVAEESNAAGLSAVASEELGLPVLGYSKMDELLEFLFSYSERENFILVLDEYPYLKENIRGIDSILQTLIDKYRETGKLTLFLLGSYVDVMKSLMGHYNPLYGRVDVSVELKQLDYLDAAKFYPAYSEEDKVRIYSVFGGIPYYNRLIDDRKTVRENIMELIASDGARLENEIPMYLGTEISKIDNANEVFMSLAKGYSRYSDILSQSHVSSGPTLVDVLDKLIRMEVVEKLAPINDENNKRKAGYYICDNLALFYYRYIFRYASQLQIMDPDVFYDRYVAEDFETRFVPNRFERICRQYLVRLNRSGKVNPPYEKIGKYYYDNPATKTSGEFDVVCRGEDGYSFFEVKFRKGAVTDEMIEEEIAQVNATGLKCHKYGFISRNGFSCDQRENTELIELRELYDVSE